ncbi:hypothetical protein HHK36_029135 [Tetracentron sinense]|uniref:Membrane insertase YidC/Oxa/ALB C-terminal domain-containing protein n=1 Tax=Tetracentron sinense TaxID=13715 RepID=A0A835D3A5_TETSI|nr:hypothetical protein HHK36_029135 [Tetracentron sinense]
MAYRRSISTRGTTLLKQRFHPSCSYMLHDDDSKHQPPDADPSRSSISNLLRLGSYNSVNAGFGAVFQEKRCPSFSFPPGLGSSFCRYMSSTIGEGSDKFEYISDVADVFTEKTMDAVASQAPAVSEVAIAAADSYYPVAALQYLIDGIHSLSGLNWWASIALTTILIRVATVPLLINSLKSTSKLTLMRPRLEEIRQQMQDRVLMSDSFLYYSELKVPLVWDPSNDGFQSVARAFIYCLSQAMDPEAMAEGQKQMKATFKEYGVTPFTPLKGLFIQGPVFVSFFLAINNMVEKVPSFKSGGAFWFTDLTTTDTLYIFPVLTAATFLITVECNMQEGLEGNPVAGTMKTFSRILGVLTIPFTMSFPQALFCYWITSNLFSLVYGLVLKRPGVKKFVGIPEIPVAPPTTAPQPAFSLFSALKRPTGLIQEPSSLPSEPSKLADRRVSSSSVISQRLRSLEKQVKGRKKSKKR